MWLDHWKLSADPFSGKSPVYVSTPGHDEAVARLSALIESAQRLAVVRGGPGTGKSLVVLRALAETRGVGRRTARVVAPLDGPTLWASFAVALGRRGIAPPGRAQAWRALADAVRVCHWEGVQPVLVVDGADELLQGPARRDLERLTHLGAGTGGSLTVIHVVDAEPGAEEPEGSCGHWPVSIRLGPLTRSESDRYVSTKLGHARRDEPAFTPRALSRLHALTGGVPRGLDRLATLGLMAGALRRLELVTPDVVDGVSRELEGFAA